MDSKRLQDLQNTRVDTAVSIAKGVLGAIPYGGGLFAEIIGLTIPNQRLDRITRFLMELDKRLETAERNKLKNNEYALNLFEDGLVQASRALSEERNRYIAVFLKKAINVNEDSYGTKKKLLYLLQELTDKDVDILKAISSCGYHATENAYYPGHITVGAYDLLNDEERYEYDSKQVSWEMHVTTLERLGLLSVVREKFDADGIPHHTDYKTSLPKIVGYDVSDLGKVFLFSIVE